MLWQANAPDYLRSIYAGKEAVLFNKKVNAWWQIFDKWLIYHKIP